MRKPSDPHWRVIRDVVDADREEIAGTLWRGDGPGDRRINLGDDDCCLATTSGMFVLDSISSGEFAPIPETGSATPSDPAATTPQAAFPSQPATGLFTLFGATGNQSGLAAPVAVRIGPITSAIRSGAASTLARIIGSFSHSANAAPSCLTYGPRAHIQPNPRGRRSSGGAAARATGAF
jgi:hypothetical protein